MGEADSRAGAEEEGWWTLKIREDSPYARSAGVEEKAEWTRRSEDWITDTESRTSSSRC